eukprot:2256140-Rhodomonas_salina.3
MQGACTASAPAGLAEGERRREADEFGEEARGRQERRTEVGARREGKGCTKRLGSGRGKVAVAAVSTAACVWSD